MKNRSHISPAGFKEATPFLMSRRDSHSTPIDHSSGSQKTPRRKRRARRTGPLSTTTITNWFKRDPSKTHEDLLEPSIPDSQEEPTTKVADSKKNPRRKDPGRLPMFPEHLCCLQKLPQAPESPFLQSQRSFPRRKLEKRRPFPQLKHRLS